MKRFAVSGAAMGTALVWSSFLISTSTAKAIARGTPTVAPMIPIVSTTDATDTVHLPSLSSIPWVWPSADTSSESFSITWAHSSGFEPAAPTSFPDVPSTSRQFVIAPLESTAYPTPPAFAPHPTKRAAVTPTSSYDGDVWSWSNLPTTSDRNTWSAIFDSIISSAIHDTKYSSSEVWETTTPTPASADTTVFTTMTVVVTMTSYETSAKTGSNTLTAAGPTNTNRARAEVTNPSVFTKRAAVTPTSMYDGDVWSWSNLPTTSDRNTWSVIFDSILSSALHDTQASDVWGPTTSTTGANTNRIRAEVTTTGPVNTNRARAEVANPSVLKKVATTKTMTALVPDRKHVRDANTAPGSFITLAARPKKTAAGVPKKGCVMSPLCGSDRKTLTTTPGLKMARISTSSCVERGTTCSIDGVLNPSDEWCREDCICVCQ